MIPANLIAPCGIDCALCLAFQRERNGCSGCLGSDDEKPKHCVTCRIKRCQEKEGLPATLCGECGKYPCRRIKDLNARYETRYRVSIYGNFAEIETKGMARFLEAEAERWKCPGCGELLCMHRPNCLHCGAENGLLNERK